MSSRYTNLHSVVAVHKRRKGRRGVASVSKILAAQGIGAEFRFLTQP